MTGKPAEQVAEEARKEAHALCPAKGCQIRAAQHDGYSIGLPVCSWPHHAAIDRYGLAARLAQAQECYGIYDSLAHVGDNPEIEPALKAEVARLSAELERLS